MAIGSGKLRHHRKRRQAGKGFNVIRSLDGVVQIFAEKSQADAAHQADEKGEGNVASLGRTRGCGRNHSGIDNANIGRAQTRGNGSFLELGHQTFVEGFVGFGFALEDVVLDKLFGHLIGFGLLLVERGGKHGFALASLLIIAFQHAENLLLFFLNGGVEIF